METPLKFWAFRDLSATAY